MGWATFLAIFSETHLVTLNVNNVESVPALDFCQLID
jgi:hypothetical protein